MTPQGVLCLQLDIMILYFIESPDIFYGFNFHEKKWQKNATLHCAELKLKLEEATH